MSALVKPRTRKEILLDARRAMPKFAFANTDVQRQAMAVISKYKYSLLVGGAGSGKTFTALRALFIRAIKEPGTSHLIIRKELTAARASIWDQGIPKMIKICFPQLKLHYNNKDSVITLTNGSKIRLCGASDRAKLEKILGLEQATVYINECSEIIDDLLFYCQTRMRENSGLMPKIICDCNPPFQSHWTYQTFIKKLDPDKSPLRNPDLYGHIFMHPRSNTYLDEGYLQDLEDLPTKLKKRFYDGMFADDAEGALWSQKDIDAHRVSYPNFYELMCNIPMGLTVVGVDPATSKTEKSDLTGIVAVGAGRNLGKNQREDIYVLADRSLRGKPNEWAQEVIKLYDQVEADIIVAESNQGGDMVEEILRNNGFTGKVELVHASKGKITRAEPFEALYEQGYVHHLTSRELFELEEEMTSYVPYLLSGKDESPDRMDALVWAGTYLTQHNNHAKYIRQIDALAVQKAAANFRQARSRRF